MADVDSILADALSSVEKLDLDPGDPLRIIAFESAVNLLAGQGSASPSAELVPYQTPSADPTPAESSPASVMANSDGGTVLDLIAAKAEIDRAHVEHVFAEDDGDVEIVVPTSKLDATASSATRELALLLAGARQAAGIDEWTPVDDVRDWTQHFKKYDQSNFAAHIKDMEDVLVFRGSSRKRQIKMTAPGWEKWQDLVRRLAGVAE